MAESTLSITRTDLLRATGRLYGAGRDPTAFDAKKKLDVDDCVDIGCRRAYSPPVLPGEQNSHNWSFLEPILASFNIVAPYSTGTVEVVDGVVTLTSGTFPTWAADGEIVIDGASYSVNTRNSSTSLTLDNLTIDVDAGASFSLSQIDYPLPDLFGSFVGDLHYRDTNDYRCPIERIAMEGPEGMLQMRQQDAFSSRPTRYAIWTTEQTGSTGQRWMLAVWPRPDVDSVLTAKYTIYPNKLTVALPIPMGGYAFAECLREACLSAAETEIKGEAGIHTQLFLQNLQSAVSFDRRMSNPGFIGNRNRYPGYASWEPWHRRDYNRWLDNTPITWV